MEKIYTISQFTNDGVTQLRNDSNKLQMISSRNDKAALHAFWFD